MKEDLNNLCLNQYIYILPILILIMKVRCKKCGYRWNTRSKMILVSCSCCGQKVKIKGELNTPDKKEGVDASNIPPKNNKEVTT